MSFVHLIKHSEDQNPDIEVVFDSDNIQSLIKDCKSYNFCILITLKDDREIEIKLPGREKSNNNSLIEFMTLWNELLRQYKGQNTELVKTLKSCELDFDNCKTVTVDGIYGNVDVSLNAPDYHFTFLAADTVPVKIVDK